MVDSEGTAASFSLLISANREMIALEWNHSAGQFEGVGFRDLAADVRGRASR